MGEPSPGSTSGPPRQHRRLTFGRSLGMVLAAAALLLFARLAMPAPCWMIFGLVALLAWPVWQYRTDYLLFRRRLVLAGAARPRSRLRAFLWKGGVMRVVQVVVSLLLAWALLVLVSRLSPLHGYTLALDAVFLLLVAGPVTRRLEGDIRSRHLGVVARRWPLLLINGSVLTGAIMALDFFVVGAPDTRHLAWHQVAEASFTQVHAASGCALWGVSAGGVAAVEDLSWHLSGIVIPNLPDVAAQLIAWSFFLLRAATVAWLYTALLLGTSGLVDRWQDGSEAGRSYRVFSLSFFLTIIVLALPFLYASIRLAEVDSRALVQGVGGLAEAINPCRPDTASRARLVERLDAAVARERRGAMDAVDRGIDSGLAEIFSDVETAVDAYLDWYFTVIGEYQRLAAVFAADAGAAMSEQLEEFLFTRTGFATRLERLDQDLAASALARFAALRPELGVELEGAPCDVGRIDLGPLSTLDRDTLRATAAATAGAGTGIVASKVLAKKTAAAVIGKVAAKKSFQSGAALATKALAKKGTSAAVSAGIGTTLCAPAGPVAVVCGVTAGLVTWLAVDKTLIELDEVLNREEMRADILAVLASQQAELGEQLRQKHHGQVDRLAGRVNEALGRTFIPYRDGLASPVERR